MKNQKERSKTLDSFSQHQTGDSAKKKPINQKKNSLGQSKSDEKEENDTKKQGGNGNYTLFSSKIFKGN